MTIGPHALSYSPHKCRVPRNRSPLKASAANNLSQPKSKKFSCHYKWVPNETPKYAPQEENRPRRRRKHTRTTCPEAKNRGSINLVATYEYSVHLTFRKTSGRLTANSDQNLCVYLEQMCHRYGCRFTIVQKPSLGALKVVRRRPQATFADSYFWLFFNSANYVFRVYAHTFHACFAAAGDFWSHPAGLQNIFLFTWCHGST